MEEVREGINQLLKDFKSYDEIKRNYYHCVFCNEKEDEFIHPRDTKSGFASTLYMCTNPKCKVFLCEACHNKFAVIDEVKKRCVGVGCPNCLTLVHFKEL